MKNNKGNNMEFEYDQTKEDILALTEYGVNRSKTIKRNILSTRIIWAITILLFGTLLSLWTKTYFYIILFSIITPFFFIFQKYLIISNILSSQDSILKEGTNLYMFGKRKIIIEKDSLILLSGTVKIEHKGPFINSIESDEDRYYIYVSSVNAYVINKKNFPDEEFEKQFIEKMNEYIWPEK